MQRIAHRSSLIALLITTACTQAAAPVITLGSNDYSRAGGGYHSSSQYHSGSSDSVVSAPNYPVTVSQNTQNTAPISTISSNDLSPPTQPQPHTLSATNPEPPSKPLENGVNPWTQKPREEPVQANATTETPTKSKSFIWPVSSQNVTSSFGPKSGGKANDGIVIKAEQGEPVWAAADGEVVYADNSLKGYGNMVLIKHKGGKTTTYANLSKKVVDKYDRVKQGDIVGYVGSTGNAKSPQLYFAVREGTEAVDPMKVVAP